MTKTFATTFTIAVLSMFGLASAAGQEPDCPHQDPSLVALELCVEQAYQAGHIDNGGIAVSLVKKLEAAERALTEDRVSVAVSLLDAFILEVKTQAGIHIAEEHAAGLAEHALAVIGSLAG